MVYALSVDTNLTGCKQVSAIVNTLHNRETVGMFMVQFNTAQIQIEQRYQSYQEELFVAHHSCVFEIIRMTWACVL